MTVIEPRFVHLRDKEPREWSEFPATTQGTHLEVRFSAARNDHELSLCWRQQDVKLSGCSATGWHC
jgi:hypothetical protein